MSVVSVQAPRAVVLIRPHHFRPNPLTAADNRFQTTAEADARSEVASQAYAASTSVARTLEKAGVTVHMFDDVTSEHPDSVFPNNWFSAHSGGRVAVYPMYAANRRGERRNDVIDFLKRAYRVQEVIDYSGFEQDEVFLEGTGAMVLDHIARVAYAARSRRADPRLLERFCTTFGYEPMFFDAADETGTPIYHTNVMMCVATDFALVCLDAIRPPSHRAAVRSRLEESGREVLALSHAQMADFAGNAIELRGSEGRILALSARAERSLTADQRSVIERSCRILPLDVGPIEMAGGSVRCMIAGIHLDPRPQAAGSAGTAAGADAAGALGDAGAAEGADHFLALA